MNSYYDPKYHVECPMAGCGEILNLTWSLGLTLSPEDADGFDPADSHSGTWQVECTAGHVVLLPTETVGCPDEAADDTAVCPHSDDDHDWSEESRAFRASDAARLRELIATLAAPKIGGGVSEESP